MASATKHSRDLSMILKDEEVAKIDKAMVEVANNFSLRVCEDDMEELLEVVSEEMTNEEVLGLE